MTDPSQQPPYPPPSPGQGFAPPPGAQPAAAAPQPVTAKGPGGFAGMVADPSTLAATGLITAVLFALGSGLIAVFGDPGDDGFRQRILNLTERADVGDVALLGIAVALLLLTPDPPGGLARPLLLLVTAGLAALLTVYALIRSLALVAGDADAAARISDFISTVGLAIAAATIAFYAAKESFLKKEGRI